MSRGLSIALTTLLLIGCSETAPTKPPDLRAVAVAESLTTFVEKGSNIRDEVIYIQPGELDDAIPKTLSGKTVEFIERDELLQKIGSRNTAPYYTIYAIGNDRPEFDFYVVVSTSGAGGFGQFEEIPWGGTRTYCYTVENGVPKVQKVESMEH